MDRTGYFCVPQFESTLSSALILAMPDFFFHFGVEVDASSGGIGGVLIQKGCPVADFNQVLKGCQLQLSTYDKELLTVVEAVKHW